MCLPAKKNGRRKKGDCLTSTKLRCREIILPDVLLGTACHPPRSLDRCAAPLSTMEYTARGRTHVRAERNCCLLARLRVPGSAGIIKKIVEDSEYKEAFFPRSCCGCLFRGESFLALQLFEIGLGFKTDFCLVPP